MAPFAALDFRISWRRDDKTRRGEVFGQGKDQT